MMNRWMMLTIAILVATACGETAERPRLDEPSIAADPTGEAVVVEFGDVEVAAKPGEGSADDHASQETVSFRPLSGHSSELREARFVQLINDERRAAGLAPLRVFWDLVDDARAHSKLMNDERDLHHNPQLADVTIPDYWARLGENVGSGFEPDSLHRAFMNSTGHRDNILGDYTHLGVGVYDVEGTLWVTVVFMKTRVAGLENTFGPFTDDDFSTHEANIHKIWKAGLTFGCGGQRYCPERSLSRGEMAAFLTRALQLPRASADYFDDDNGAWYEASANAMFASRVTHGCGERRYCGDNDVSRGEMAAFLTRAFELQASGTDHFRDDDGTFYESSANAIREAGYTYGCGDGRFCGERELTRAEMASFLARALNL